jgi:Fe-S cluster assembly iron-binding protein IscA
MALDEPRTDDQIIERGDYKLLVDPQTNDLLQQNGGLTIDYVDGAIQKGYMLRLNSASQEGCGSGEGGCASCG